MPVAHAMETVLGQPSWKLTSDCVEAWVTEVGAQLGPVHFSLSGRTIQPFHVAPWHSDGVDGPPVIQSLRGDFFCMPFGSNERAYGDEQHPLHGETANEEWAQTGDGIWELDLRIRVGKVRREVMLRPGQQAVYVCNQVSGLSGPMCFGNHAMLAFNSPGLVSTSPFQFGQVFPGEFESPAAGGYSSLKPGEQFQRLELVPMANGSIADLSRYPDRDGFEDLVMLIGDDRQRFAWNAVVFPQEGYLWYCLRNPRILRHTILWHSNGGRHYAPWNGRHRRVLGIEDVTAYFHLGLAESCAENELSRQGVKTHLDFDPSSSISISSIMGVAQVGPDAEHVEDIVAEGDGIQIRMRSGEEIWLPTDIGFLGD